MSEIVLSLASLLLTLFCLIYSCARRKELYFPMPKGFFAKLQDQRTLFFALLVAAIGAAAASLAEALGQALQTGTGALLVSHTIRALFHATLPCLSSLYVLALSGDSPKLPARPLRLFLVPLLMAATLILTNPLTQFCFTIDEALNVQRGPGTWALITTFAFYVIAGIVFLVRFCRGLPQASRRALAILLVVTTAGGIVQATLAAPVELFFTSVALFGCMTMFEQEDAPPTTRAISSGSAPFSPSR